MRRISPSTLRLLQMFASGTARECLTESLTSLTSTPKLVRPRTSFSRGRSLGKACPDLHLPVHHPDVAWIARSLSSSMLICQVHGLLCRNLTAHEAVRADFRQRSRRRGQTPGLAETAAFHHTFSSGQQRHHYSGTLQASAGLHPRVLSSLQPLTAVHHGKAAKTSQAVAGRTQTGSKQHHT